MKDSKKLGSIIFSLVVIEHFIIYYLSNFLFNEKLVDPKVYYNTSVKISNFDELFSNFYPGSKFFIFFITPIVKVFQNFYVVSFIFSCISLVPFYYVIEKYKVKENNLFQNICLGIFCFMPSIHVWLTSIYKDVLVFALLFLYFQIKGKTNIWLKVCILLFLFLIRPYLGFILIFSFLLTEFKSITFFKSTILLSASIILAFLFIWFMLPNINVISITKEFETLNNYSISEGASTIDLFQTNFFQRFFYLMFGPILFLSSKLYISLYSMENVVLLLWFTLVIHQVYKNKFNLKLIFSNVYIVFAVILWIFIGMYIYNYGLASRMKVMIVPFLILGFMEIFNYCKSDV